MSRDPGKLGGALESRSPAWIRWGPTATAAATGVALIAGLASGYLGILDASHALERGEGDVFLRAAHQTYLAAGRPPQTADIEAFLEAHRDEGLRYVALVRADAAQRVVMAAGEPHPHPAWLAPGEAIRIGDRVRLLAPPLPPPPRPPPPHGSAGRMDQRAPEFSPGPPVPPGLLIEFEPALATRLRADGRVGLIIGTAAAAAFVLFALLFARVVRQRETLARRLEQDRRMAALGEMSAVLAHEIRNPLASLKGHAQLLLEAIPADGHERPKIERVVHEALRLENLTTDLLDFVRSGEIARRDVDPAEMLRASAEEVGETRFDIRTDRAPGTWSLDPVRMRQALVNVLRNASQASPEGTRAQAAAEEADGRLLFIVRDHGEGIPPGEEDRIFEPFHTRRARGTGLGLAVARRVVALHGGTITAGCHPDGGAVFRISIPREREPGGG